MNDREQIALGIEHQINGRQGWGPTVALARADWDAICKALRSSPNEAVEKECNLLQTVVDEAVVLLKVIDSGLADITPDLVAVIRLRAAIDSATPSQYGDVEQSQLTKGE